MCPKQDRLSSLYKALIKTKKENFRQFISTYEGQIIHHQVVFLKCKTTMEVYFSPFKQVKVLKYQFLQIGQDGN